METLDALDMIHRYTLPSYHPYQAATRAPRCYTRLRPLSPTVTGCRTSSSRHRYLVITPTRLPHELLAPPSLLRLLCHASPPVRDAGPNPSPNTLT